METTGMTYGEALIDPTTVLYKADRLLAAQRKQRMAQAEQMMASKGVTLEQALQRIWTEAVA